MLEKLLAMVNEELVLEARELDWGHDAKLLEQNLRRTPAQRLEYMTDVANFVLRNRGAAA